MSIDAVEGSDGGDVVSVDLLDEYQDYFSDKIHAIARLCITPFWAIEEELHSYILPLHAEEYGQAYSKIQEVVGRIAKGILLVSPLLSSLPFAILGMGLTKLGNMIQNHEYRYVEGNYVGEFSAQPKIFHLNTCMLPGALPCEYGGVTPASMRFNRLVATVRENDPDFVFLSEFNKGLGESMVEALKDRYNHFAIDIGLKPFGLEAGFFIAYRGELVNPPEFIPFKTKVTGAEEWFQHGYFILESPGTYYVCTHLHVDRDNDQDNAIRRFQLDEILDHLEECEGDKRVVLVGDLNFDRSGSHGGQYQYILDKGFTDPLTEKDITSTNALQLHMHKIEEDPKYSSIDYMIVLDRGKGKTSLDIKLLDTYQEGEYFHEALSDHKALLGVLA